LTLKVYFCYDQSKVKKGQRGQAILIVVLVMAIALTVGLAIVSRSITDVRVSRQGEESARAFSAAEAGIEKTVAQGLYSDSGSFTLNGQEISYSVASSEVGGDGVTEILFSEQLKSGEVQSVWLVGHSGPDDLDPSSYYQGATVSFYWGNEGTASDEDITPALEATLVYQESGSFKIKRAVFDPSTTGRKDSNNFSDAGTGDVIGSEALAFGASLDMSGIPYLLRLKLLYNESEAHYVAVRSGDSEFLPSQGTCYRSSATVAGSDVSRSIEQCRFYDVPPALFDYVLYSGQGLTK